MRVIKKWAEVDSNHRRLTSTDLQSAPFSHSGICPHFFIFNCSCRYYTSKLNFFEFFLKLPMTRLELVTSPLPRECATTAPHGLIFSKTLVASPLRECQFAKRLTRVLQPSIRLPHKNLPQATFIWATLPHGLIFSKTLVASPLRECQFAKRLTRVLQPSIRLPHKNLPQATFIWATLPHGLIFSKTLVAFSILF